jgi:hypothetical protein
MVLPYYAGLVIATKEADVLIVETIIYSLIVLLGRLLLR